MLTALVAVLDAYKDYGKLATRDSEEYTSLTLVRRAIRNAKALKANKPATNYAWQCNECGSNGLPRLAKRIWKTSHVATAGPMNFTK
jgi:hypothetical protein